MVWANTAFFMFPARGTAPLPVAVQVTVVVDNDGGDDGDLTDT